MSTARRVVLSRFAVLLVAVAACALAWRVGGGGAPGAGSPGAGGGALAIAEDPVASPALRAPDAYEIVQRLVDAATGAGAQRMVEADARSTHSAWLLSTGPAARHVMKIALPLGTNEASFDQRDALVAAPPTTFSFRVDVPRGAKLTFAEGTANAIHDGVGFVITVVDARNQPSEIYRHVLAPTHARRWTEASCDLARYAGQTIELRLSTELLVAREHAAARLRDGGAAKRAVVERRADPIALWGSPTLLALATPRVSHNVLWISVSGLRPDAITSFHDAASDAAKLAAPYAPLEALLPHVASLTPAIDALAGRGVRFTRAYSAGSWARPGTLGMLAGARLDELGLDAARETLSAGDAARFYASDPPLLSLVTRRRGVSTQAFVDGALTSGAAGVGVDMGFEHVVRHGDATRTTLEITRDATSWLRQNSATRFFAFVSYRLPRGADALPPGLLERVPPPPAGPADEVSRRALAETAGVDEAIGTLMQTLTEAGLRERTIVILTADHAQALSSAHVGGEAGARVGRGALRDRHADVHFEETTHVPLVIVAPGLLPEGRAVNARVRTTDVAPTVTELLGFEAHARFSGLSLVPLASGEKESDERVVVTAGRETRAIIHGRHRLVVRSGPARAALPDARSVAGREALYDLVDDPGERHDLASSKPDVVAEMRARLDAALRNAPVAGSAAATAPPADWDELPSIHVRFAGGGRARRVSGTLVFGDARIKALRFSVVPVKLGRDSLTIAGDKAELSFTTSSSSAVGFDIVVDPPATPVTWDLYVDERPWPADEVFAGPYGLPAPELRTGVATYAARLASGAAGLPPIDPRRESGMFIVRRGPRRRSAGGHGE